MAQIRLLSQDTIDKIAAGEVVEAPSSIVKELAENSIDAGAHVIKVEITDGGVSMIRVTDNGRGIMESDVKNAFLRHATSKLSGINDLDSLKTLGFRGEALSSIAAVSQVELITKTSDAQYGCRYCINGGIERSLESMGAPNGTSITVSNLFYNVPARKKFLKSAMTEASHVQNVVERLSLSHPEVGFTLTVNGQIKHQTSGDSNLKNTIYSLYGRDYANNIIPLDYEKSGMRICGYIGTPQIVRGNRSLELFDLNGRYFNDRVISRAIEDAYHPYMMLHKYPFTVFHLYMNPENADVNVHPGKMEVKFRFQRDVYDLICEGIGETLKKHESGPQLLSSELSQGEAVNYKSKETAYINLAENIKYESETAEKLHSTAVMSNNSNLSADIGTSDADKNHDTVISDSISKAADNGTSDAVNHSEIIMHDSISKAADAGTSDADKHNDTVIPDSISKIVDVERSVDDKYDDSGYDKETQYFLSKMRDRVRAYHVKDRLQGTICENSDTDIPCKCRIDEENVINTEEPVQMEFDFHKKLEHKTDFKIIGQLFSTYYLVELSDEFLLIDQHAAHEKVLYEEFVKKFENDGIMSQMITPPVLISLNLSQQETYNEHRNEFEHLGFEVEAFGGDEFIITAVPSDFTDVINADFFMELLDEYRESLSHRKITADLEHRLATMACKAAVKGNMNISAREMEVLIDKMLKSDNPYNCPHGRPTMIRMTRTELEKKFRRVL